MAHRRKNAPLKGARAIGSNMTEVEHGDLTILYSYQTPVAFLSSKGGYITDRFWSNTTSKHIAKFFARHGYDRKGAYKIPQDDLAMFVSVGHVRLTQSGELDKRRGMKNPRQRRPKGVLWDQRDIGLYADEANGDEYRREVLAGLLNDVFSGPATVEDQEHIPDLIEALEEEPSDDYGEEEDALDLLNRYTDGVYWIVDQGLLLEPDAEEGRD